MNRNGPFLAGLSSATAAAGWVAAVWLMWGPILRKLPGHSAGFTIKDYYLSDQYAYMAIAHNVSVGVSASVEPFTQSGSSIYPSAYYWLLGVFAKVADTTVFGAWNIVGMLVTLGLLAFATVWARWALPGRRAWVIAPLAILFGTLQWYVDGHWLAQYGEHAVLWAPFGSLFSPGAEGFGLLALGLGLMALGTSLASGGRRRIVLAVICGGFLGLTLQAHTYVGMFAALVTVLFLAVHESIVRPDRRWTAALIGTMLAFLVGSSLSAGPGAVTRLGALLAIPPLFLLCRRAWRRDIGTLAVGVVVGALVVAAPLLIRIARQASDPNSFFYFRQRSAEHRELSLPPVQVFLQFLPLWLLAVGAIVWLGKRSRTPRETAWLGILAALLGATVLLTFNDAWAFHTEPYRFLPYGTFLVAIVALPWLWQGVADGRGFGRARISGISVAIALAATAPTTLTFAHETSNLVFGLSQQERTAYQRIAASTGYQLTIYDRCFRPGLVKVTAGGRIFYAHVGIAIPDNFARFSQVVAETQSGKLPTQQLLKEEGVRYIVTHNHCGGLNPATLRRRFGTPVSIRLEQPTALGAPPDLTYEVFRVDSSAG